MLFAGNFMGKTKCFRVQVQNNIREQKHIMYFLTWFVVWIELALYSIFLKIVSILCMHVLSNIYIVHNKDLNSF